jgi:hypothetical protein
MTPDPEFEHQHELGILIGQSMVLVEPAGVDQGHITGSVLGQDLLRPLRAYLLGELGEPCACLADGNDVGGSNSHEM